jgi:glycosyltransferase involved in cell wall biosynthesis
MNTKKISIIIPTLNEEKLIARTLGQFDDITKKKFDLEVIVSDGGSTDSTVSIAKKYADKIIVHNETYRQNISQGRNRGAEISSGNVLIFLNADTKISDLDLFFKLILEEINSDHIVAIACKVKVFKNEEKKADKIFHFLYNNYVRFLNKFVMGMGRGECHILNRNIFDVCGGYDEKLFAGEDFDLYRRIHKFGKISFLKNCLIYESPRRYRKFGYVKVFWDWSINSIWVTLFGKSISKNWEEVR